LEYLDALEDWVVEQSTSHPFTLTKDNPTSLMRQKEQALEERILPIQKRMEANQQIQNAIEQLNSTLILAKQLAVQEERNLTSSSTVVPLQSLVDRWETWLNLRWKEYTEKEPFDDSRIQLVDIEQCNAATQTIWSEIAKLYRTKTTTTIGEKENPSNATTTAHDEL
jgi:anaerobic glycerol-3-phosphate dehydrogenase